VFFYFFGVFMPMYSVQKEVTIPKNTTETILDLGAINQYGLLRTVTLQNVTNSFTFTRHRAVLLKGDKMIVLCNLTDVTIPNYATIWFYPLYPLATVVEPDTHIGIMSQYTTNQNDRFETFKMHINLEDIMTYPTYRRQRY
jgi:hypothetical protein